MEPVIEFAGYGSAQRPQSRQQGDKRGRGSLSAGQGRPLSAVDNALARLNRNVSTAAAAQDAPQQLQQLTWQQQEAIDGTGAGQRPPKRQPGAGRGAGLQQQQQRQSLFNGGAGYENSEPRQRPQSSGPFNRNAPQQGRGAAQGRKVHTSAVAAVNESQATAPPGAGPSATAPPGVDPSATGYVSKPVNNTALQHQSDTRFSELGISPVTKRAMAEVFGYEFCTKVQAQSIPVSLGGEDVLAKAKTGTGKTIAFMLPAIDNLLRRPPAPGQVGILVLSPTRELAMQIHTEAEKLAKFMDMKVQVVIGGTNMNTESKKMDSKAPQVLIGTPGRVLDHLTNESSSLGRMVKDLRVLIFDEADNLLDMGFRPTIDKILAQLPGKETRQTLLFSATFPKDVQQLASYAFRKAYKTVDTVGEETGTNVQVQQMSCVVPPKDLMTYLCAVIKTHMSQDRDFKVIVFFPTARQTQLYSETFDKMGLPIKEMHSRKSQGYRTRVSEEFRAGSGVIMFSSDVSARGVDYPDVSLVVQVGLPTDRDQYVHRVGRTARAGKTGESLLLLADFEAFFLKKLKDLPIRNMGELPEHLLQEHETAIARALSQVPYDTKSMAYAAWLGFYKSAPGLGLTSVQVVERANEFSQIIGCPEPPELEAKTIGKMGLKGVPGLRIAGRGRPDNGRQGRDGGGGRGSGSQQEGRGGYSGEGRGGYGGGRGRGDGTGPQ
ncbi:hypothetical protein CEUSTIGMA_g1370.t1 [Chlamydomonas eustigma]|uniref:ATP-dependent RNA helicase n=1 Tax=Chlamydomonas eustigma TaxID=1157962 RepID=A0A250WTQ0_9CHLO|nr:hypothetical protein CEUSTIGMA_g1370.t1 [Chlamydomonas eustigma]|eukprot:GAX73920.1 hypothetical protein CEUSTIGMA_g1370.t1 [Chlamydomonas eustigma]